MPGNIFVSWFVDGKFLAALGSEVTSCCFIPGPQPMRRRRNRDRGPVRLGSLLRRACLPGRTKSAAFAIVEVMALSLLLSVSMQIFVCPLGGLFCDNFVVGGGTLV